MLRYIPLVFLTRIVTLAQIDEVDHRFGRQKEKRVDDIHLESVSFGTDTKSHEVRRSNSAIAIHYLMRLS